MPSLFELVVAYGITFGLMNKIPYLHKKPFFKDLLKCSYCTGFHAGYITFLLTIPLRNYETVMSGFTSAICLAFASAAFSYVADVGSQYLETNIKE